jgi:hypothetical protein
MLQYGHLELADKIMDAGYIQHDPNVPRGPWRIQAVHEPGRPGEHRRSSSAGVEKRTGLNPSR